MHNEAAASVAYQVSEMIAIYPVAVVDGREMELTAKLP
jgi:hypothetical protein